MVAAAGDWGAAGITTEPESLLCHGTNIISRTTCGETSRVQYICAAGDHTDSTNFFWLPQKPDIFDLVRLGYKKLGLGTLNIFENVIFFLLEVSNGEKSTHGF